MADNEITRAPCCHALANPAPFTQNSSTNASGGIMLAFRSGNFQLGLVLATAFSCSTFPTAGQGYTPEEQQACSDDAFRLCSAEIPDVDQVTLCMVRNKSQLSPGCRVFFRPGPEDAVTPVAAGRPLHIAPAASRKPVHKKPHKSAKK